MPFKFYDFSQVKKNKTLKKYQFSLHPPQVESWTFSSPTRIYRSFYNDFSVPIVFKKFNDCEIEDIALFYDKSDKSNNFYENINNISKNRDIYTLQENKINNYINFANINNEEILYAIKQ